MLAAVLLVGIGYLSILPPFEGFDEYVHYSSVRQVADTGTVPIFGRSFIDQTVVDYASHGPMPWSSGNPPFAGLGPMTYPSFFANPAAVAHYEVYRISPLKNVSRRVPMRIMRLSIRRYIICLWRQSCVLLMDFRS